MTTFAPRAWRPHRAPPLRNELERNDVLLSSDLWPTPGAGPEDVVVDRDGAAITGLDDGRIVKVKDATNVEEIANVGGRPLGIEWLDEGVLVVCNTIRGVQRVTMTGEVTNLAQGFEGMDFIFTNNAAVATSGMIYFSDSSTRWTLEDVVSDLLECQPTGRVFSLAPDGEVTLIMDGLQLANGVALDPNQESIFIAETGRYRVHRHWIGGTRSGETDVFLDNLAGFPDNLTFADGILWVSMTSPRQAMVDTILPRPWLKKIVHGLPESAKPKAVQHGMVLGYDIDGALVHNFQDSTGTVATTSSARYHDGRLFIGSLESSHLAVYDLS